MSRKNIFEFSSQLIILGTLCAGLVGCGSIQPVASPTSVPSATPTSTIIPTDTLFPPTPTQTPLPFMALDGLRVAYIIDGNLYVQDSGKQAMQLTNTGRDSNPTFTDDGQKIIFYRASESPKKHIYSINSDGSGERVLVTSDLLLTLDLGYDEITELISPAIVPGTHQMLFSTQQLNSLKLRDTLSTPNNDLLLADIDTGTIKQLLAIGQGGDFLVSPDGKLVAVQAPDRIDVITIQGQIVYQTPFTYPEEGIYAVAIPMTWTQDSRELFVVPPIPVSEIPGNRGFPLLRTIWRYSLDENSGVEIRLDPPPVGYQGFRISPDGNWIVYSYQLGYPASVNWDPGKPVGIYLGNLYEGTSKLLYVPPVNDFDVPSFYRSWSPDSTHFIVEDTSTQTYIGNIHGETVLLSPGLFVGWIDSKRYLLNRGVLELVLGEIGKQELITVMETPLDLTIYDPRTYVFIRH
jgi:dipeptidyl aminopeptidase/acylaminoacyl peptidase